ncbi:MAG: hypothetical protein ACRD6R_12815, partial [Candidatus Polarisedimenticolia bacterium]
VRTEDAGLLWTPLPGDGDPLGTVLSPVAGPGTVVPVRPVSGQKGLALEVSGRVILLLPGSFDDVQVEAELDVSGFRGRAGLVHHVAGTERAGIFRVDTGGEAVLAQITRGAEEVLDRGRVPTPPRALRLAVSAAGSHFKGMAVGAVVAHGHRGRSGPGGIGLFLDGSGVVTVVMMRVAPLPPH